MSVPPTTPKARAAFAPTTPLGSRGQSQLTQPSPHYTTTRRHSLYGVEDRVIIDPGSRIWKVGFSGEGRPRDVFYADGPQSKPLWNLGHPIDEADRIEEGKLLEMRLQQTLRSVFHDSLLADPKARKVIVIEQPLLPLYIKELIARILFDNHVPSVSFASSHLLSLFAIGRITGLVVDCGHLESIALPIFAARPMFFQIQTSPLAGSRLTSHLRALLLLFATYVPPPTSLNTTARPSSDRATRVPEEILTDTLVEEIKTRFCFVGDAIGALEEARREFAPAEDDDESDVELPPSSESAAPESEPSERAESEDPPTPVAKLVEDPSEFHLQRLAALYKRYSTATDIQIKVVPPSSHPTGTGRGTLIVPGWIRERAAEVLFEGGDVDECSVAEVVLDALLKVPRDLRKTLASSVLVVGGSAMMPGFIPRLQEEIVRAVAEPVTKPRPWKNGKRPPPPYDKFKALRPLTAFFAILNNPSPSVPRSDRAAANAGKAPGFAPAALPWIGGSLSGALKIGGAEISREKWDQQSAKVNVDESMDMDVDTIVPMGSILPDWTRSPLPTGAPAANARAA